jgi:DNA repair protein RadA/Sms
MAPMGPSSSCSLLEVGIAKERPLVLSDQLKWLTEPLGQFWQGYVYLVAGQPGSRKSGLSLQVALDLAQRGQKVLFILTEEPASRLLERALRMMSAWPPEQVRRTLSNLLVEENLQAVEALPRYLGMNVLSAGGRFHGVSLIVLDSIQGQGLSAGATAEWESVYEFFRLCQMARITVLAVCHSTKRHDAAGPRSLQHNVDAIVVLRQMIRCRLLFVVKNRGGPASLSNAVKLELDPITLTLREAPHAKLMTAVARTYLGAALGAAEVQSSVGLSGFGSRGRVVAPGLPRKEIEQLIATIGQIEGVGFDDLDFQIQCRLPGDRVYRGVLGLPLCLALMASFVQKSIPPRQLQLGEIDLFRNVRDLPAALVNDLATAISVGELPTPLRLLVPPSAAAQLPTGRGVEVVPVRKLDEAMFATWPELR